MLCQMLMSSSLMRSISPQNALWPDSCICAKLTHAGKFFWWLSNICRDWAESCMGQVGCTRWGKTHVWMVNWISVPSEMTWLASALLMHNPSCRQPFANLSRMSKVSTLKTIVWWSHDVCHAPQKESAIGLSAGKAASADAREQRQE